MKNISIQLLNSFSKKEIHRFSRFISSTYFNTDNHVLELWNLLKQYVVNKRPFDELWQAKIYTQLFEKKMQERALTKKEKSLLNAKMSLLVGLARRFLIIEGLDKKEAIKSEILYDALLEKRQLDMLHRQIKKEQKVIDKKELKDIDFYGHSYIIENGLLQLLHQKRLLNKEDNISKVNQHLDLQFLLRKLKLYSTALSLTRVSNNKNYDFSSMKAIEPLIELPEYAEHPLILLQLTIIELMQSDEEDSYFRLLQLLDEYEIAISAKNLNDFYNVAINFCIGKIIKGDLEYNTHLYKLFQRMDEKKLLPQNGHMSIMRLKNIISLSCRMGDFDWANELLTKYQGLLGYKDKDSIVHFNLGMIAFYETNYKAAISHFIRVKKVNVAYDINCRVMLVKSHYELDQEYDERTMTIFRSTGRFITKHKSLNSRHKKGFNNFIRLLSNTYRLKFQVGKGTREKVLSKINTIDFISDKKWLLDKLEELT